MQAQPLLLGLSPIPGDEHAAENTGNKVDTDRL